MPRQVVQEYVLVALAGAFFGPEISIAHYRLPLVFIALTYSLCDCLSSARIRNVNWAK